MWFFLILLGGFQQETGIIPNEIGIAQWAPGIAGLLMLLIFRKDGFKINIFSRNTPWMRYVYAVLIPLGLGVVVYLITSTIGIESTESRVEYTYPYLLILWAPIGAFGEELGWRGYLQKYLNPRMQGLLSSLLVGLLWTSMHIHFFQESPLFIFFVTLSIVSYSFVIYALVQDTGFNVLLATIFHTMINFTNMFFLDVIYESEFMIINGFTWSLFVVILLFIKKDLFFKSKT
jgi:membrane protease YdiL (CAAX protease family)